MPWYLSLKGPGVLAAIGLALTLVTKPSAEAGGPFFAIAVLWVLVTGKSRRIYYNARLRTRASMDERAGRSR